MASVENSSYTVENFPQIYTAVEIYITFDIYKHHHWNSELQFVIMSIPYAWFQFGVKSVVLTESHGWSIEFACSICLAERGLTTRNSHR